MSSTCFVRPAWPATRRSPDVLPRMRAGVTEREVARWIDDGLRDRSEGPGFDTIVARAERRDPAPRADRPAAAPRRPGHDGLRRAYGGYHADMTRTVAVGERGLAAGDLRAGRGRAAVRPRRPGGPRRRVDAAARDLIRDAGHGDHFQHGLGHGVGLEIHEAPNSGRRNG